MGTFLSNLVSAAKFEGDASDINALFTAIDNAKNQTDILTSIENSEIDEAQNANFLAVILQKIDEESKDLDLLTASSLQLNKLFWKLNVIIKTANPSLEHLALHTTLTEIIKLQFSLDNLLLIDNHDMPGLYNSCLLTQTLQYYINNKKYDRFKIAIERACYQEDINFRNIRPDLIFSSILNLRKSFVEFDGFYDELNKICDVFGLPKEMMQQAFKDKNSLLSYEEFEKAVASSKAIDKYVKPDLQLYTAKPDEEEKKKEEAVQKEINAAKIDNNKQFIAAIKQGMEKFEAAKLKISPKQRRLMDAFKKNDNEQSAIQFFQYMVTGHDDYTKDKLFAHIKSQIGELSYTDLDIKFINKMRNALIEAIKDAGFSQIKHMKNFHACLSDVLHYFQGFSIAMLLSDPGKDPGTDPELEQSYLRHDGIGGLFISTILLPYLFEADSIIDASTIDFLKIMSDRGKFYTLGTQSKDVENAIKSAMQKFENEASYIEDPDWTKMFFGLSNAQILKIFILKMTKKDLDPDTLALRFMLIFMKAREPYGFLKDTINDMIANPHLKPYLEGYFKYVVKKSSQAHKSQQQQQFSHQNDRGAMRQSTAGNNYNYDDERNSQLRQGGMYPKFDGTHTTSASSPANNNYGQGGMYPHLNSNNNFRQGGIYPNLNNYNASSSSSSATQHGWHANQKNDGQNAAYSSNSYSGNSGHSRVPPPYENNNNSNNKNGDESLFNSFLNYDK